MPEARTSISLLVLCFASIAHGQTPHDDWALDSLSDVVVPFDPSDSWSMSPIDRFCLQALERRELRPSPESARRAWIRRVTLDLTGLPPTLEEIAAFLQDESSTAGQRVVDRLLASPRYGERWARHWLDVTRFAESHGYEQDYDRKHAWPYRDFVVQAWNADLPFDTFVHWQLAGDELAPDDASALAATGFLGAGAFPTQLTEAEFERARYDEIDDMVATTGVAFLGLTMGCARCHDHKFDPIAQDEYYELAATFAHAIRSEVQVTVEHADPRAVAAWKAQADALEERRVALEASLDENLAQWVQEHAGRGMHPPRIVNARRVRIELPGERRILTLAEVAVYSNGMNVAPTGTASQASTAFGGVASRAIDGNTDPAYARGGQTHSQQPARDPWWELDLGRDLPIDRVVVWNRGESLEDRLEGYSVVLLDATEHERQRLDGLPAPRTRSEHTVDGLTSTQRDENALLRLADDTSDAARERARALFRSIDPRYVAWTAEKRQHAAAEPHDVQATYQITSEGHPPTKHHADDRGFPHFYDQVFHLSRGDVHRKGNVAEQGFPVALTSSADETPAWMRAPNHNPKSLGRRARLAYWLTDVDHGAGALLARVLVNRLWQHHFGRGLVATPNDFGSQGERPTHPELLDWLAGELIRNEFHIKPIQRLIVTSALYAQSSRDREDAHLVDPENRWLWRFEPRRVEGEVIRDAVLAVSGRLDDAMGGPGTLSESMRRRSLYFFVKRSQLIPTMIAFDWPEHLVSIGRRPRTATAPQALWFLNHETVRAAARDLASRARRGNAERDALERLHEITLGRLPNQRERALAHTFLQAQTQSHREAGHDDPDTEAWVDYAQAILALPEFRTLY